MSKVTSFILIRNLLVLLVISAAFCTMGCLLLICVAWYCPDFHSDVLAFFAVDLSARDVEC